MSRTTRIALALALAAAGATPLSAAYTPADLKRHLDATIAHRDAAIAAIDQGGIDDCNSIRTAIRETDLALKAISDARSVHSSLDIPWDDKRRSHGQYLASVQKDLIKYRGDLVKLSYRAC